MFIISCIIGVSTHVTAPVEPHHAALSNYRFYAGRIQQHLTRYFHSLHALYVNSASSGNVLLSSSALILASLSDIVPSAVALSGKAEFRGRFTMIYFALIKYFSHSIDFSIRLPSPPLLLTRSVKSHHAALSNYRFYALNIAANLLVDSSFI